MIECPAGKQAWPLWEKQYAAMLGWKDQDAPDQAAKRDKIAEGDRIAIKKILGGGKGHGAKEK
jgi:hypothetical protein